MTALLLPVDCFFLAADCAALPPHLLWIRQHLTITTHGWICSRGLARGTGYWTRTIRELRHDLTKSGKLSNALVDTFLGYCADPGWWTQTIAFTAVHGQMPGRW